MKRFLWVLVGVLTMLRLAGSWVLPFTGDEAYYWEWSRKLALGYIDHPAGVAWTVAATQFLGISAGAIRAGFWLCGVVATFAMADCAARIARARASNAGVAAATAALLTTLAPIITIAFATVSPDGPFLASWALALDAATILLETPGTLPAIATGLAIGVGLETRAFAVALLCGIVAALRHDRRHAVIVACVALLCTVPLICWNASHAWTMIIFTLMGRHVDEGFSLLRPLFMILEVIAAFGIGPAIIVVIGGVAGMRRSISPLIAWTSLPLSALIFALSFMERTETYWLLGPYLSLSIATAVLISEHAVALTTRARVFLVAPPLFLLGILYLVIFANVPLAHVIATQFHARLKRAGPFDIYGTAALARDLKPIAARRHAIVFADGYGLASLLNYYAGFPPVVIGYSWQGRELRHWFTGVPPHTNGLFVDKEALSNRPDFARRLALACMHVRAGPIMRYAKGDLPQIIFPTTWCLDMKPNAIAILRWEQNF